MDAGMRKAFQVKVRSLTRTFKEYRNYQAELQAYDLTQVSQDKKQQEFYQESKSALDHIQNKLIDYFQQLRAYLVSLSLCRTKTRRLSRRNRIPLCRPIMLLPRPRFKRFRRCSPLPFE